MDSLNIELMTYIATMDVETYYSMLAIPIFARYASKPQNRLLIYNSLTKITDNKYGKFWTIGNNPHREDGPAKEFKEGKKAWYQYGKKHRVGGPAMEFVSGAREWFYFGNRHRVDGPAIELANGSRKWYLYNMLHRDEVDGMGEAPAVELVDGTRIWYKYGKLHRDSGPAVEYANGNLEWWIDGVCRKMKNKAKNKLNI